MKKIWLSLLIVLSIALQSFVAVADSNKSHQVDAQHLQTEHSHSTDNHTDSHAENSADNHALADTTGESEHHIEDCHHCGHCQGSHSQWLTAKKAQQLTAKFLVSNQYFYLIQQNKSFIEELIRPPIA